MQSGEVDIADFLYVLWAAKWLLFGVPAAVACIAMGYAVISRPVYKATGRSLPPTVRGLVSYNAASQLPDAAITDSLDTGSMGGLDVLSPSQAWAAFIMQLGSEAMKEKLFEAYYLLVISKENQISDQRLGKRLDETSTITQPTSEDASITVTPEGTAPHGITDWANRLVVLANESTKSILLDNLKGEIEIRKTA
jgi:LPS O-antigen subunit length determinant protein (WzzB/FepE family)